MKKRTMSLFLALAILCSLFVIPVSAADTDSVLVTGTYQQSNARSMLGMINDFRTGDEAWAYNASGQVVYYEGLSSLAWDYELEKAAMQRAMELSVYYNHTRPDGSRCFSAYTGYTAAAGENIAIGYGCLTTAQEAFALWQETEEDYSGQGHRRNMLSGSFTAVAVAYVRVGNIHCWVQEFRSPASGAAATAANDASTTVSVPISASYVTLSNVTPSSDAVTLQKGSSTAVPTVSATVVNAGWSYCKTTVQVPVTWISSDESVCSVADGTISAVNAGTAVLTASYSGGTVSCNVTVSDIAAARVTGLKATATVGGVSLSWDAVAKATGYLVYRQTGSDASTRKLIGVTSDTGFTDTEASAESMNYYNVYPYLDHQSNKASSSPTVWARAKVTPVSNLKAVSASGGVNLSWDAVPGATGYLIYRQVGSDASTRKLIRVVTGTSYTDVNASTTTMNYYNVYPYVGSQTNKATASATVYARAK